MRVFISWSGEHSKQVAEVLREWLPMVIQAVKPWVSAADIEKGETWFSSIQGSLTEAKGMGIFCLTPDNLVAPWLAFEAGALSAHDRGRVATFLHKVEANAVKTPLSLFQATKAGEKADVFNLLKSVNGRLDNPLEAAHLQRAFDASWESFSKSMDAITVQPTKAKDAQSKPDEMLKEILNTVRRLERDVDGASESRIREDAMERMAKIIRAPVSSSTVSISEMLRNQPERTKKEFLAKFFDASDAMNRHPLESSDWREPPDMGKIVVQNSKKKHP